jgi:hypothetical protein
LELHRLQNKVLPTIGNLPRRTPIRDLHMAFKIPNLCDFVAKLCRQQATVIRNNENFKIRNTGQGEDEHKKHKRLTLGGGQVYALSSVSTIVTSLGSI